MKISEIKVGEIHEGLVTSIDVIGKGIVDYQGFITLVPFTIPEELIWFQITNIGSSFADGDLIQVLEKSHERMTPKCPYFGECKGCQFQHMRYDTQVRIKEKILKDALKPLLKLKNFQINPIVPAKLEWYYRRYIKLTLYPEEISHNAQSGYKVFYHEMDLSLLEVNQCPIFIDGVSAIFDIVRKIAAELVSISKNYGEVILIKSKENSFILLFKCL